MDMRIRKLYCQLLWLGIFSLALSAPQKFDVYVASDRGISQAKLSYLVKQTEKPPLVYSTKENHGPKFLLANTAANNRIVPSGAENSKNFRQYINSRHYSANKQRFASRPITENIQQSISSGFKYNTQPSVRTGDFSNGQKSLTNQLDQSSSITKDSINSASLLSPSKRNTRSNKSPSILSSMFRNMKGFRDIVPPTNQLQRPRDISSYWPDIANDRLQPIINDVMFQEEDDRVLKRSGHVFLPPLSTTEVSTENQNSMSATITSVYRTEQNSNVDLQQSSSSLDIQPKHKIESHPNSSDDVYQLPIHYNILNPKIEIREDRNQQTTFSVNLDKNIDTGKIMISYTDSKTPNYSFGEKDLHKVVKNADIKGTIGETLKGMAHETKKDLVHLLLHKFPYNTREISSKPKNIRERGKNFIDNGKMYQTLYRLAKAIPLNKVSNEIAINQTAIESDTFSNNIGVVNNTMIQQHESPKKSSEGKNDRFVTNENTTKTTTPSIPGNSIISQSSSSPAVQSSTALIATKNKNTKQSNVEQQNKYYNKFPPKSNSVLSVTSNATKETLVRKNNTRIHSSTSASPSFVLANLQSNLEVKVKQMDMATVRTLDDSGAHVFGFQTTEKNPYSFTQIITSGTLKGNPFKSTSTQSKSYPSTTVTAGEIQNTGTDVTSTNTSLVSETTGYLNNSTDRLPTIATPNTTNLTNLLPTFISEITKSTENITEVSTMKTIQYMKDISNVESLSGTTLPPNILGSQYLENLDENKNNFVTSAQTVAPNELSIDLDEISDYIEQFINIKNKSKRLEKIQKDTTIVSTIKDHENKDAKDIENRDIKGIENKTVRGDKNKIFKGSELKSIENKDIKANQNNDSENKDGKVSKNKDVKVSKNKDVKRSKTKDFKSIKNKSVEHKENKDVKSNKNKDVKSRKNKDAESSKTKGVKRSEKKDVKSSKIKDTKRSEKKDDKGSKKTDVKGSKNKDVEGSENRDIKGSDHKNVKDSEINYVKGGETKDVSKDGIGSKNKGVKGSEKEDVKGSGKRDDKSSKSKDVERSKNKDIKRSGNKDVKRSENKDVTVSENKDVRGSENKDTKGSKNKDVIIQIHSTAQNYSNNQENKDSSILYTNGHQPFPVKASEVDIKVNIRQDGKEIEDLVSIDTSKGKYEQNTPIVDTSNTTVEFRDGKTLYDSVLTATENSTGNGKADLSSKSKTLQRMNVSSGSTRGDIIGASDFEKFDSVANPSLRREEVNFTLNITIPTVTKRNIEQNKSKNIYRAEADINKITAIALDNNITGTNEKEDGSHAEKVINENIAKETQNPKKLGTIKRRKSKNNFRNGENKSQADLRSGITITEHNAENATMKHSDKIKISITKKRKVKKDSKKSSKRRTGKNQNSSDTKKKTPTERYVVSTETVSSGKGNKFKTLKNVSGKEKKEKEKKEVKQETAWLNKTVETRTNERNELTEEKKKLKQKVSKLKTDVIKRDREKTHFTTIKKKRKKVNEKAKKKRTSSHKSSDIKKNNTIETEALFKQKGFQPAKKSHKDEGGNVSIKETTTKEKNDTEQMKQRNDLFKKISPRKEQNVLNKQENKRQNPRSNIQKSNQTEAKSVKKKIEDKSYPTNTTMKLVPVSNKKERDNASQTRDTRNPVFVESNKTAMARERKGIKVTTINDSKSQNISTNTTMEKKIAKKTVLKNREKKQSNITQQKSNRKNKQTKEIKTSNENLIENMKKSEVGRNATKEEDVAGGNLNKTVLSTEGKLKNTLPMPRIPRFKMNLIQGANISKDFSVKGNDMDLSENQRKDKLNVTKKLLNRKYDTLVDKNIAKSPKNKELSAKFSPPKRNKDGLKPNEISHKKDTEHMHKRKISETSSRISKEIEKLPKISKKTLLSKNNQNKLLQHRPAKSIISTIVTRPTIVTQKIKTITPIKEEKIKDNGGFTKSNKPQDGRKLIPDTKNILVPVNVREELKKIVSHKAETQVNKVALIRQEAPSITARTSTEVIPLQTVMTTLPSPIPMTGGGSVVNSLFPRITKSSSGQVKQTMSNRISDSKIPYGLVSSVEGSVDTLPTAKASLIQTSNNEETMNTLFDYNTLNQNASERMVQPQTTKTDNNTALPLGERDYSFPLQTNRILNERKRDGSQNAKDVDSVLKSPVSGNQLESLMPPPPIIPTSTARTATEQIIRFIGKASDLVEKLNEKKKRVSNMMVNIEHEKGNTLQPTSEAVKIYYNSSTERAKNLTENIPNDYQKPDPLNKNHNKVNTKQYDADKDLGKGQRILEDYRKLLIDNRKSIKTSAFDSDVNSLHQNVLNGVNSKSIFNGVKRNGEQPFVEWLARRDNLHLNKGIPPQIPTIQDGSENVKSEVRSGNTIPDILKSNLNTRGFIKPLLPSVNRTLGQRTNSAPCNSSLGKEEIMSLAVNVLRLLVSNLKLQQALQRSHENIVSTNLLSRKYLLIPLPQGNAQTNHSDRHANKLDKQIIRKGSYSSASFLQNQIESFLKKSPMQANMDQTPQVKQRLIRKRPSAGPLSHKVSSVVDKKIKRKVIHKHGKGILQNTLYNNLSTRSKQHKEKATYRENEMKDDNVENHLPKLETRIKFHTTKSKKN